MFIFDFHAIFAYLHMLILLHAASILGKNNYDWCWKKTFSKCPSWLFRSKIRITLWFMHSIIQLHYHLQLSHELQTKLPRLIWRSKKTRPRPLQPPNVSNNYYRTMAKRVPMVRSPPWSGHSNCLRPQILQCFPPVLSSSMLQWWTLFANVGEHSLLRNEFQKEHYLGWLVEGWFSS